MNLNLIRVLPALLCASLCLACTETADEEDLVAVTEPVACDAPDVRLAYVHVDDGLIVEDLCAGTEPHRTRLEFGRPFDREAWDRGDSWAWMRLSASGRFLAVYDHTNTLSMFGPITGDAETIEPVRVDDLSELEGGQELLGVSDHGEAWLRHGGEILGLGDIRRAIVSFDALERRLRTARPRSHAEHVVLVTPNDGRLPTEQVELIALASGAVLGRWTPDDLKTVPDGCVGNVVPHDVTPKGQVLLSWRTSGCEGSGSTWFLASSTGVADIGPVPSTVRAELVAVSPGATWWSTYTQAGEQPAVVAMVGERTVELTQAPPQRRQDFGWTILDPRPCLESGRLADCEPWSVSALTSWSSDDRLVLFTFAGGDFRYPEAVLLHDVESNTTLLEHIVFNAQTELHRRDEGWDAVVF